MKPTDDTTRARARRRESDTKNRALRVECPTCNAPTGEPCGRESDRTRIVHTARVVDAVEAGEINVEVRP